MIFKCSLNKRKKRKRNTLNLEEVRKNVWITKNVNDFSYSKTLEMIFGF
jgi:hypothetical protein